MNRPRHFLSLLPLVVLSVWPASASAQRDGTTQPQTQRALTPAGETQVNYFSGGSLTHSTQIPSDSAFNTTGRGSGGGGVAQPCYAPFSWFTDEPNPNAVIDEMTGALVDAATREPTTPTVKVETSQASTAWIFMEITPSGQWSPELQGQLDAVGAGPGGLGGVGPVSLSSTTALGDSYRAMNAPLAEATRRFQVNCGVPEAYENGTAVYGPDGPMVGFREIGITDPFWNPLVRLGVLWGMVQLPPFRVITPPEVSTYGGLVVNMPTWLQIEAAAWRPYFTAVDEYMGWQSQLGLFPNSLQFEVVGEGGRTVRCAPAESAELQGAIPSFPADLPRYYEVGQLERDCTWVPQAKGSVTVRARISYNVLLTISGYSEWLSPYVWYSDPLTMTVGELRSLNVTPEGGIGG
jgi:hypothetical protein